MTETEIKLPIAKVEAVRRLLRRLGWRVSVRRHLEHNLVFDREGESLLRAGYLLRVRFRRQALPADGETPGAGVGPP